MQCKRRARDVHVVRTDGLTRYDLFAVALPPLRPAAFFCAVVPPCDELLREEPEPEDLPPRLEDPGELAIFAARSFDMPLSFSASYCFSFLTLLLLLGMDSDYPCSRISHRAASDERPRRAHLAPSCGRGRHRPARRVARRPGGRALLGRRDVHARGDGGATRSRRRRRLDRPGRRRADRL